MGRLPRADRGTLQFPQSRGAGGPHSLKSHIPRPLSGYPGIPALSVIVAASMHPPAPDLGQIQQSEYAETLRRMRGITAFAPALEREYLHAHLERVRTRLKTWFILMLLLDLGLAGAQLLDKGVSEPASMVRLALLVPSAVLLVSLAWTALYYPFYLRVAPTLVAIHSTAVAVMAAQGATTGQSTELGTLMAAVFYFCGLRFRQALTSCGCAAVAFLSVALFEDLPRGDLVRDMMVLLLSGAICAAMYWDVERSYRRSFLERRIIGELLARDGLTNLMNRRTFDERLHSVWKQGLREQRRVALLLIDVDHFKRYNDTFGHIAGDVALRSVAQVFQQFARRPLDVAARYGGEEFAIILYDLASDDVFDIVERVLQGVRNMHIPHAATSDVAAPVLSVSVGACVLVPSPGQSVEAVMRIADEALYEAKRGGRDRAVIKTAEHQAAGCAAAA